MRGMETESGRNAVKYFSATAQIKPGIWTWNSEYTFMEKIWFYVNTSVWCLVSEFMFIVHYALLKIGSFSGSFVQCDRCCQPEHYFVINYEATRQQDLINLLLCIQATFLCRMQWKWVAWYLLILNIFIKAVGSGWSNGATLTLSL